MHNYGYISGGGRNASLSVVGKGKRVCVSSSKGKRSVKSPHLVGGKGKGREERTALSRHVSGAGKKGSRRVLPSRQRKREIPLD